MWCIQPIAPTAMTKAEIALYDRPRARIERGGNRWWLGVDRRPSLVWGAAGGVRGGWIRGFLEGPRLAAGALSATGGVGLRRPKPRAADRSCTKG